MTQVDGARLHTLFGQNHNLFGRHDGALWLRVGQTECDFSEATRLQAAGPILEPRPAVSPALLPLGHKINCKHIVHSVTQKRDFVRL